jgi:hypothetical protein
MEIYNCGAISENILNGYIRKPIFWLSLPPVGKILKRYTDKYRKRKVRTQN